MAKPDARPAAAPPTRWFLAALGVLLVGLAAVGVVVPGLPATPFLLVACGCFARSFPGLEQRLVRTRLFAPYVRYLDRDTPITPRMRLTILAAVWACVGLSTAALWWSGGLRAWSAALVGAGALLGSIVILRFRRTPAQKGETPFPTPDS